MQVRLKTRELNKAQEDGQLERRSENRMEKKSFIRRSKVQKKTANAGKSATINEANVKNKTQGTNLRINLGRVRFPLIKAKQCA
jgi:hypothetical protein